MLTDERRCKFMATYQTPHRSWNLFASVLQEILAAHGLGLGHLDDRAHIHREKVRRLQLSLRIPKSFPVLNIDEMEQVITIFQLTRNEKTRLRAAILATSIEETLMDRINPDDALKAAEQIFSIIEQALQEHAHDLVGIGAIKGGGAMASGESEIDRKLGNAFTAIDHATLALHLSRNADSQVERVERAQQALNGFRSALAELDKATSLLKIQDVWQVWHDEAQNGLTAAQSRLASLGA
jgi:tetratricopeptide (TPR) repeat protein